MNNNIGILLATVSGVAAGVIIGILLAPKSGRENRNWVTKQTGDAKDWVGHKSNQIVKDSEQKLATIANGLKQSIPDLYEATSSISFEEEEIEESV